MPLKGGAGKHSKIGGRMLAQRSEVFDALVVEDDELDVVVRRETDDVSSRFQGGECRRTG